MHRRKTARCSVGEEFHLDRTEVECKFMPARDLHSGVYENAHQPDQSVDEKDVEGLDIGANSAGDYPIDTS